MTVNCFVHIDHFFILCLRVSFLGLQPADLKRFAWVSPEEFQHQEGLKLDWQGKEPSSTCQLLEGLALQVCLVATFPLGEAAQWSQVALCAGGVGGRVALAKGRVTLPARRQMAAGAGGFSPF